MPKSEPATSTPEPAAIEPAQAAIKTPKYIAVASGKGGSGKTTTVRNLSVAALHAGLKVTTIDLDESPTLTKWYSRRPDIVPDLGHIHAPINTFEGDLGKSVLEITDVDLVLIDTPPSLIAYPTHTRTLLQVVDMVLIPTQQYDEDLDAVIAWMIHLKTSKKKAFFILNDTQRRESSLEDAKRRLVAHGNLAPIDVPHYADIPKTTSKGLGVVDVKGARGAVDYIAVFDFVRNQLSI